VTHSTACSSAAHHPSSTLMAMPGHGWGWLCR
jgi:hypothetical protein